jgi:pyrroloquinoline quinone (PQQ) biosynthesis protein C
MMFTKESLVGKTWVPVSANVVVEPLDPTIRLALTSHVRLIHDQGVVRQIDLGGKIASLDLESGQRVTALLAQLDGTRTLDEAARALGWDLEDTVDAAQDLYLLAALHSVGETTVQAFAFFQHVSTLGRGVQARLGTGTSHAGLLLNQLMSGRPSRRLLLGYLVELYHIVTRAALHINPTINLAPDERVRAMLCEYLSDEFWHGQWQRQGLRAAGLTDEQIDRSDPLPGTLAALDRLRCVAGTDLLAYAACISTGEGSGDQEVDRVRHRYELFARSGVLPMEAIAPFRDHEIADCTAGHFSYCSEIFAEAPPLTHRHQDAIRRAMLSYLRCFEEQHRQIEDFYGSDEDGPAMFSGDWIPPREVERRRPRTSEPI